MPGPPPEVLDLFAVPPVVESLAGGRGMSVRAGDLVLSPGRDDRVQEWLSPLLARLAVRLDERPVRRRRDLRVAMPVPARDGSWVVQGWGASRYEPGTTTCRDLAVTLAAGRVLHAELAAAVPTRPAGLEERQDRWARAERLAFGELSRRSTGEAATPLLLRIGELLADLGGQAPDLTREQLVHADLAGNVLLDAQGAPVVIDVSASWRSPRWAEAVCVLDSVLWLDAPWAALAPWAGGSGRRLMLRALAFRLLSDVWAPDAPAWGAYERIVDALDDPP